MPCWNTFVSLIPGLDGFSIDDFIVRALFVLWGWFNGPRPSYLSLFQSIVGGDLSCVNRFVVAVIVRASDSVFPTMRSQGTRYMCNTFRLDMMLVRHNFAISLITHRMLETWRRYSNQLDVATPA